MFTRFKLIALATGIYFFTGCKDNTTTTDTNKKDTTLNAHTDSTANEQTSDNNMTKTGTDLMGAMNSMMDRMHNMKMTGDFDIDWATMMIEHHQGALDMAQVEISQGKDEKMKSKAQEILTKQKDEQQVLRDLVKNLNVSNMKMGGPELERLMSDMMSKMKSMQMSENVDKDFATMMIQHHQDGISMSKKEAANGMNAQLKKMAQKMISDQQKDISEFKNWLSNK